MTIIFIVCHSLKTCPHESGEREYANIIQSNKFGKIQKCLEYESKFSDNIDKTYLGRVLFFMFNQVMEML